MKKLFILVTAFFMALGAGAQVDNGNRMVVHQKDGAVKAFACDKVDSISFVKTGDISAEVLVKETMGRQITLDVTMPEGCSACEFAIVEKKNEDTAADIFEFVAANKAAELKESGTVTFNELEPETEYVIYTVSKDVYGIYASFVRTEAKTSVGNEDFQINIKELTSGHMNLDIIPLDKNMTYTYTLLPKKKYDEAVDYNGDIFMYDVAWWQFMAENYGESDWRNIMIKLLVSGDRAYISDDEYGFMDWDTDHIFYCYGINEKGDATTPLYTKEFRTPKPVPSDNQISVEILDVQPNGCNVRVTTTNNDDYVVTAQRQSFIEYWEQEGTETDMLKTLYADLHINSNSCGYKHSGSDEFFVKAQKSNTDYVLIVFGNNEGPTTDVQYIKFKTASF